MICNLKLNFFVKYYFKNYFDFLYGIGSLFFDLDERIISR